MADLVVGNLNNNIGIVVKKIAVISQHIKRAAETVRQNKKECQEIVSHASRVSEIVTRMNEAAMLDSQPLKDSMDSLAETLERALELVASLQKMHGVRSFLAAPDIARQLQRIKNDMVQKLMLASLAINVQTTMITTQSLPPSWASQPQDAEVVDSSDSHHSADDNRSGMDGEENNVPAAGCITPVASLSDFSWFSLSDLEAATNDFSEDNIIGSGPYYSFVYKGVLRGGQEIAIKSHRRFAEFSEKRSVDGLKHVSTKLKHQNILGVLGYALGHPESERRRLNEHKKNCYGFLVVEEKMHGSLHQIIRGSSPINCNWNSRFKIIKGIADGLRYLHDNNAVHSNLKPSNILIDTDDPNKSKICDFGVARVLDNGDLPNSRYLAPEYLGGKNPLTTKSDVYAFGLILLETIRSMCEAVPDNDPKTTITWASEVQQARRMNLFGLIPGRIDKLLLNSQVADKSQLIGIKTCMEIGLSCTKEKPEDRPTMVEVVGRLR